MASYSSINKNKNYLWVRNVDDDRIQISFDYNAPGCPLRTYNMSRHKDEEVGITLSRLAEKIAKITSRHSKTKGKKGKANKRKVKDAQGRQGTVDNDTTQTVPDTAVVESAQQVLQTSDLQLEVVSIDLLNNGTQLMNTMKNSEAWTSADEIRVGDSSFTIQVNPPSIKSFNLPKCILVGYPIYPKIDVEFASLDDCKIDWFREIRTTKTSNKPWKKKEQFDCSYTYLSSTLHYEPVSEDVGHHLKAVCTPRANETCGKTSETVSEVEVSSNEGVSPFEKRFEYTRTKCGESCFRIVTYNLLADTFSTTNYSKYRLYPYCDVKFLNSEYRKLLILKELTGYNADLLCLQEVDKRFFENELTTALGLLGYKGDFIQKGSMGSEGEALFYRENKFRLIKDHSISISAELFGNEMHSHILKHFDELPDHLQAANSCSDVDDETKASIELRRMDMDELKLNILDRKSVLQAVVLECLDNKKHVIAATTHLVSNATADHIRLIQTEVCVKHIQTLREKYTVNGDAPAVVFSGDMNSSPLSGVYEYMINGTIPANYHGWYSCGISQYMPIQLQHNMSLMSACGAPDYTNFIGPFHGCLDYIFVSKDRFNVKQIVPLPSHEDILLNTALPSKHFPSDHLALVCDIEWKQKEDNAAS